MKVEIDLRNLTVEHPMEVYRIMQAVLHRENKFEPHKEHFWVLALDYGRTILNLEHVSTGTANRVIVDPAEVLSIPLQKGASGLMLIHNHPSGRLDASEQDLDLTDMLIQACKLMKVPVLDHIIITEHSYLSFKANGHMDRLEASNKYKPPYELEKEYHEELEERIRELQKKHKEKLKATLEKGMKQGEKLGLQKGAAQEKVQIAQQMLARGYSIEDICQLTGLSKSDIAQLKA